MRTRLPLVVAAGLALLLLTAAGATSAPRSTLGPDILLITLDTLRADALGFAGNRRAETPVLDRLAAGGRVFPDAHAHNVVTLPSHANILTGLYPHQHGVRENSGFRLGPEVPTLATLLAAGGYATAAFVGAFPLDSQFGLDRGFDLYDDRYSEGSRATEFVVPERRGDEVVARAVAWWRANEGKKRFAWVHLFDPHAPYAPPEPWASRFRDHPYLGEVAATDAYLAPLLTPFLDGKQPPALVVVTSDHGEALGDHGELTHGLFAYEPTLRVPLVVWGAGVKPGSDPRPARHVDILPTVLAAAGVPAPAGGAERPGRSLLGPPPAGAAADSYFESLSAALNRGWAPLTGVIRDGTKLIALPLPELYDLTADPREERNLFADQRRLAHELRGALPAGTWPPGERTALPPAAEVQLRSLGYLTSEGPLRERFGPEDDPKRLVHLDSKIHRVVDLYSRRQLPAAEALARELVGGRPEMPLGHSLLAQTLLEQDRVTEAVAVMQGASRAGAASDTLLRQLGLSLIDLGRAREALAVLEPLAAGGDPQAVNALALALSEAGRQDDAEATLRALLATDPDNPSAYESLGLIALRRGDWAAARDHSRRALDFNPGLPLAWNNLGVALYQLRAPGEALAAWERAVTLDPRLWDALYNLGLKAAEHGRPDLARQALTRFLEAPPHRYAADLPRAKALLARLGGPAP